MTHRFFHTDYSHTGVYLTTGAPPKDGQPRPTQIELDDFLDEICLELSADAYEALNWELADAYDYNLPGDDMTPYAVADEIEWKEKP